MENNDNILENVARIAADHMATLVDKLHEKMDSRAIIFEYIVPWAKEAEAEYQRTREERESEGDYLDWLDAFVKRKIDGLTEGNMQTKMLYIVSATYTAEYGAIAFDYQNAYFDKDDALHSLMNVLCRTYQEVGGINLTDHRYEEIKNALSRNGEHREYFGGNGNQYVWRVTKTLVTIPEDKEKS